MGLLLLLSCLVLDVGLHCEGYSEQQLNILYVRVSTTIRQYDYVAALTDVPILAGRQDF